MTFCSHCGAELKQDENFCSKCGSSLRHYNKVSTQGKRFINFIIDYVGFFIFAVIIVILLDITGLYTALGLYQLNETFLGFLLITFYYVFFETLYQKTPAKFLTKTKVIMANGQKPDFNHIFGRTLSRFIPFEPLSFLFSPIG